jgi:hypothetical protein
MTTHSTDAVRIGGAAGFLGDSATSTPQLVRAGVDYLVYDYLAEATMSVLARAMRKRPEAGYARDFTDRVWAPNLRELVASGTTVVTNAGGMNPHACRDRMEQLAAEQGIDVRIALVEGDDLRPRLEELAAAGLAEMSTGAPLPEPATVLSANAYLGAFPIAEALQAGADVVLTGRVVDSALTLGPLIHEFGWGPEQYDLLAAGSLAGHVIECGAQATGGLFTDWETVPDWAHIGYPIAECRADGAFQITKPQGTGGLCTPATVTEQILYEIDDPQRYVLPDVVCDFAQVQVSAVDETRVEVTGVRGHPPTTTAKVCVTHEDGYRSIVVSPVVGRDAARKAERQAAAVIERTEEMLAAQGHPPYRAHRVEALGAEASYGPHARARDTREVACRISVEHEHREALESFLREVNSPVTSMAVGSTGWFGSPPTTAPVVRVSSYLLDKREVAPRVVIGDQTWTCEFAAGAEFDPAAISRPAVEAAPAPPADSPTVPLIAVAHGRSGDKGDGFNIGIVARRAEYLPALRAALTEEAVAEHLRHEFNDPAAGHVVRYELPGLLAMNFVFAEALGGGQFASLRLDPLAKGKAQQLLDMEIAVPAWMAQEVAPR